MTTKIHWAAAMAVVAITVMAVGCRTTPEPTPSATSGTEGTEPQAGATEEGRASTPRPSDTGAMATGETPFEITGRVDSIEASRIEIAGKTLAIDSSTSITKGGVGASLEDIKEGDEVRATMSGSGDPPKAARIEVMSPETSPAPGAEERR